MKSFKVAVAFDQYKARTVVGLDEDDTRTKALVGAGYLVPEQAIEVADGRDDNAADGDVSGGGVVVGSPPKSKRGVTGGQGKDSSSEQDGDSAGAGDSSGGQDN